MTERDENIAYREGFKDGVASRCTVVDEGRKDAMTTPDRLLREDGVMAERPQVEEFKRLCADQSSPWGMADSDVIELCDYILELEKKVEQLAPKRRHMAATGECGYCDRNREQGSHFHPKHDASPGCESGKHNHCSCEVCF